MNLARGAIRLTGVTKGFRLHHRRRHFLTLKSTLIRDLWRRAPVEEPFYWALKGIDLEVQPGETLGIIGANGSGKSTLLKLIAGILRPTAGTLERCGRLSALIELGAGFHPEISGRENVFINGIMLGLSRREIQRRFDEIVEFAELQEFIDNPVKTYSSGMFMRLGFAVAVHVDPDILLIDEVLAVGDQSFIFKCLDRIHGFKQRGKTMVMVSHDMGAIEKLCDRAVWIRDGLVADQGRPRRVTGEYLLAVARKEERRFLSANEAIQAAIEAAAGSPPGAPPVPSPGSESAPGPEPACSPAAGGGEPETEGEAERWGNRKVVITAVQVLDRTGAERYVFESGEALTVSVEFEAAEPVDDVVFGVGFFTPAGVWVYGTNTQIERLGVAGVCGRGSVRVHFPALDLVEGTLLIDVAVHARDGTPYDYRSRLHSLAVRSPLKDSGIYRPAHRWEFSPQVEIDPGVEDGAEEAPPEAGGAGAASGEIPARRRGGSDG